MKRVMVSLASLVISLVLCATAEAQAHRNAYGGSTSHSYGSTSHTNAYGGSSSHTAGQGTSHSSTYGTSTSHAYGGGTSHTNAYGGTTSGAYGAGAVHTTPYGTTASASAYHPPVPPCLLWIPSTYYRGLLRNRVLQLRFDWRRRSRRRCSRHGRWRRRGFLAECRGLAKRLCSGLLSRRD